MRLGQYSTDFFKVSTMSGFENKWKQFHKNVIRLIYIFQKYDFSLLFTMWDQFNRLIDFMLFLNLGSKDKNVFQYPLFCVS